MICRGTRVSVKRGEWAIGRILPLQDEYAGTAMGRPFECDVSGRRLEPVRSEKYVNVQLDEYHAPIGFPAAEVEKR